MPSIEPILRPLTVEDAGAAVALAQRVGWSQQSDAWQRFIRWSGGRALCFANGAQLVATAIPIPYGERLAWIAMVITDPDYQGRGLARQLMHTAMDALTAEGVQSIMLDASQQGYPLYEKIGFRNLDPVEIWAGEISPADVPSSALAAQESDLADIIALDTALMGVNRAYIIREMCRFSMAWVARKDTALEGYLLAQRDERGVHFGPWYHRSPEGAHNLLRAAVNTFPGQQVRLQIPEPNPHARAMVERYGLTISRVATRMVYGTDAPGNMTAYYGIAGFPTG